MTKSILNIVLWGIGNHAEKNLLPAIKCSEKYNLYGIVTRKKDKLDQISNKYECMAWEDYDEMLSDPSIDIVFLSTPPLLHFDQGMKIMKAGKHFFCEKPLSIDLQSTIELLNFAEKNQLAICEALMYQYHPHFYELKKLLNNCEVVNIKNIRSIFRLPTINEPGFRFKKELGASCLYDVGIYPLSLIYSLFDGQNIEILSKDIIKDNNVDIAGSAHLKIDSRIKCYVDWSYNTSYRNEINILGDNISLYSSMIFSKNKEYTPVIEITNSNGNVSKKAIQPDNHFRLMIDYFAAIIDDENKRKKLRIDILGLSEFLHQIKTQN